jgi:hypothetical protein
MYVHAESYLEGADTHTLSHAALTYIMYVHAEPYLEGADTHTPSHAALTYIMYVHAESYLEGGRCPAHQLPRSPRTLAA